MYPHTYIYGIYKIKKLDDVDRTKSDANSVLPKAFTITEEINAKLIKSQSV